ncbi:MAG: lysylphosphatidylglycerol synthase transmembrane domain-containing protein [Bacteroidales bacterium]|nr:lysylphosphatidylglycerol synthase transmembrane domain-containing protein [Bacteroidales bacterium]
MKKKYKNIIKTFLFISIGIGLFYLVYKDFDIDTILTEIKNVNYWWFIPMFIMGILSHVSRSIRWQMLLNSDGSNVKFANTFMAVLNGYFANIALPRLGEVTRCAIVSKYEKQNFSKVLGTMVSERITDVLMLVLVTILAFLLQSTQISQFIANNPDLGVKLQKFVSLPMIIAYIIVGSIGIVFLVSLLKGKLDHFAIFKKLADFIKSFWKGILSIKKVKSPFWYFFHSVFIWAMYFLMLYICFFAFEGFAELGIITALIVFVAGSFGMVAPAPNGIGAYHFMIIQTFVLYGIATEKAAAFALIVHGIQTFILVIAGLASFILLPIINKE